jgi:predicted RNA-binding protein with PUA-like domain
VMTRYWLLKSEPSTFSWQTLVAEGETTWDGVRNHQAKRNLASMAVGDKALFYHSMSDKAVVGVCTISQSAYADPTDETGRWVAVSVVPVRALKQWVSLATIKAHPDLQDVALIKQSRLSVVPLTQEAFETIVSLGNNA